MTEIWLPYKGLLLLQFPWRRDTQRYVITAFINCYLKRTTEQLSTIHWLKFFIIASAEMTSRIR
jgi:hypothetical protein